MSLLRLVFFVLLIYLAVKLFKNLLQAPTRRTSVKGTPKSGAPLDLSDADIEDAEFKEIDDD